MKSKIINMDNKLVARWRINVNQLIEHYRMNMTELARVVGRNPSTIQGNFGGSDTAKNMPSPKTISAIETQFQLPRGALSKEDFSPKLVDSVEPQVERKGEQLATLSIPISANKLARIMRILNE